MKKLKVGMVAVGRGTIYGNFFSANPITEVVALCDTDLSKLSKGVEEFNLPDNKAFDDYSEFIEEDFDIAVIGSPMPAHASQVCAALSADKHVLCEVTAASDLEGCRAVYEAAKKSKGKFIGLVMIVAGVALVALGVLRKRKKGK